MNTVNFEGMSHEQLVAAFKQQQETLARLLAEKSGRVSFQVSMKGAISVYGLGRMPVTLYPSQWDTLFSSLDSLKAFVEGNRANCDKQSALVESIQTEGKAKGYRDEKLDAYLRESLISINNPYVKIKN
jgi:hypothetical protein